MTTPLLLDGYRPIDRQWPVYMFDPVARDVETRWFANQREAKVLGPKCGVGDFRVVGGWFKRRRIFIAIYVHSASLYLFVNGIAVSLLDKNITVKRETDWLLRKHFSVSLGANVLFTCRYSYLDNEDVPDQDIFSYVSRISESRGAAVRTMLIWQDKINGKDEFTDHYYDELSARVAAILQS